MANYRQRRPVMEGDDDWDGGPGLDTVRADQVAAPQTGSMGVAPVGGVGQLDPNAVPGAAAPMGTSNGWEYIPPDSSMVEFGQAPSLGGWRNIPAGTPWLVPGSPDKNPDQANAERGWTKLTNFDPSGIGVDVYKDAGGNYFSGPPDVGTPLTPEQARNEIAGRATAVKQSEIHNQSDPGAGPALAALFAATVIGPAAFSSMASSSPAYLTMADTAGGLIPEFGSSAAYNAAIGSGVGLETVAATGYEGLSGLTAAEANAAAQAGAGLETAGGAATGYEGLSGLTQAEANAAATEGAAASGAGAAAAGAGAGTYAPVVDSVAGPAGMAGATGYAATAGAGLTLAEGLRTAGTLAGAVTAVNSVLGDPLKLNETADKAKQAATDASTASAEYTRQMADIAKQQWDFYKTNYQPVEIGLIKQAAQAGSPEEFARARGAANADVTGSFDRARKDIVRDSQAHGINPASGAAQSTEGSIRLAEGASRAGALTGADNLTRNLMWSKGLDVANLGRNIPGQSSSALANAANTSNQSANVNSLIGQAERAQNSKIIQNMGYGLNTVGDAIDKYGPTVKKWFGYSRGGRVMEGKSSRIFGPHMRHYAAGGSVDDQGLNPNDMGMPQDASQMGMMTGPGNETSDSIPAVVDGQEPAALSTNEFVMNSEVPKMSGEEILEAINQAGLAKRQGAGLEPKRFAAGGRVNRRACSGL